jgi:RNAse (barnase) inhibitor barstar
MEMVKVNGNKITSWKSFHDFFARTFGFPEFYGKNMNAWMDCMNDLDCPEYGMISKLSLKKGEVLTLVITNVESFKQSNRDIYDALIECSAHINQNRILQGQQPLIFLAF